jgi:lipoprotein-anchoring transpeptidase ErfK/SrfK
MNAVFFGLLAISLPVVGVRAQEQIAATKVSSAVEAPSAAFSGRRTREMLTVQVLLDRARFSPGVIDGLAGANVAQAVRVFRKAHDLPGGDSIDRALLAKLQEVAPGPILVRRSITEADLGGPYIAAVPTSFVEQAKLERVGYTSAEEALAERFHMSETLLRALNPGVELGRAGAEILVVASRTGKIAGEVARVEVDKTASAVNVYDAQRRLLASYPATIGSADMPTPQGSMQVEAVATDAAYYFDPEKLKFGPDKRLQINPGPNNPVGGVWIDLTEEGYGIHGAPDPKLIRKTASHGCVRLTNWDAQELAQAVKPGVLVEFIG